MRFNTKAEYGLAAIADIAIQHEQGKGFRVRDSGKPGAERDCLVHAGGLHGALERRRGREGQGDASLLPGFRPWREGRERGRAPSSSFPPAPSPALPLGPAIPGPRSPTPCQARRRRQAGRRLLNQKIRHAR